MRTSLGRKASLRLGFAASFVLAVGVAGATACSSNNGTTPSTGGGPDGGTAISFASTIYPVMMQHSCPQCHGAMHPGGPAGGLDLSTETTAYSMLVSQPAAGDAGSPTCASTNSVRVKPGDAANSLLYKLVAAGAGMGMAPCGFGGMPLAFFDGGQPPPLSTMELAAVMQWIDEGANP